MISRLGDPLRSGTRNGDLYFEVFENEGGWVQPGNKTFLFCTFKFNDYIIIKYTVLILETVGHQIRSVYHIGKIFGTQNCADLQVKISAQVCGHAAVGRSKFYQVCAIFHLKICEFFNNKKNLRSYSE